MRRDPFIRSYAESPPHNFRLGPESNDTYGWPDEHDDDVAYVREQMQEGGPGMYVLKAPRGQHKVLVQAHYPEDVRADFAAHNLSPPQQQDYREGRLVVVKELGIIASRSLRVFPYVIDPVAREMKLIGLVEFKRNNRQARRDLKRKATKSYHMKDLYNVIEQEGEADLDAVAGEIAEEFAEHLHSAVRPKSTVLKDIGGGQ